ncbi:MAG: hypothetical protein IPL46_24490 [Saprospiraceae bacterium]|nr:hypothetical protein [Saprospiraceae bacterium]
MKDHYSFIEAYHQNKLSPEQKSLFEKAMEADPDLKVAVNNYWKIEPVLDLLFEDDIRSKMNEIRTNKTRSFRLGSFLSYAAAILLLAVAGFWFWQQTDESTPEQLFVEFYKSPLSLTSRGDENADQKVTPTELAVQNIHKLIQSGDVAQTEEVLQKLLSLPSNQREQVEWLMVMSALKAGDKELAKKRLDVILSSPGHLYNNDKSKRLAKKL